MTTRFAIFVDGSNIFGSLMKLGVKVLEYQDFYKFVLGESVAMWKTTFFEPTHASAQLWRVFWYQLGFMDELNLADARLQATLRERFNDDQQLKRNYMALAGPNLAGASQDKVAFEAWNMCFKEAKEWYEDKKSQLEGTKRFNYGVRSTTDFIDIIECGHWL